MALKMRHAIALIFAFGVVLLAHPLYLSLPPFRILALDGLPRFLYEMTGLVYLYVALLAYWTDARGYVDFRRVFLASLASIPLVFGGFALYQGPERMDYRFIMWTGGFALLFYPMTLGYVIGRAEDSAEYVAVVVGVTIVAFVGAILLISSTSQGPLSGFDFVIGTANLIGIALVDGVFGYPLYRLGQNPDRESDTET